MFRLDGKTALVTGASQGIGTGIGRALAAQGSRVVLAARTVAKLEELSDELKAAGAETHVLELDLADTESLAGLVNELPPPFDEIDILVNNAGVTADGLFARMKLEEWERVIRVNLTGAFELSRVLSRGMMRRRWGRIISISSVVGLMGNAGQANYAASKAGLIGFSKSVARELAPRNITSNVVAPGFVETAMSDQIPEKAKEMMFQAIALKRLGTIEDVAAAVVYLASEEAGYVTGHVLNVSGGLYM